MNDQNKKLGVSGFLPPVASACLVRAAADARRVAWDNSLRRAKIIDAAIRKVKLEYPRYFRAPMTVAVNDNGRAIGGDDLNARY